ncbi:TonB-dependent receptor plug domain-containing protein [Chitinophaga sp. GCM10012297]|uniref:TonB-dependent receptor n=1 Tax=Chitinophaga chungangae TaxID=2821488 RepID=A0ABS3YFK9_9BACT|nr:TonB-dependent receptor [Chitinophaga chungangae]MBO9153466.1 TonB-dependent receptor [Chitinophaga chungangae]
MSYSFKLVIACILIIVLPAIVFGQQHVLSGKLWDPALGKGVDSLVVTAKGGGREYRAYSDSQGRFSFGSIPGGHYTVDISSILFKTTPKQVHLQKDHHLDLIVSKALQTLQEFYVTANEGKEKMTSTSVIDRKAMQHLQPSSFTDLLELLPGGRSADPQLLRMNQIRLREAGNPSGSYDISSLGTAFLIDGAPINTSANLQSATGFFALDPNESRSSVNKGVDMRTLSTDQIEKVEVIRGIPSVEYGDLTSSLIKIERRQGATPYSARVKADGFSKLFSLGKGFYIPEKDLSVNIDLGYLNAKDDPRDNFLNYKRINASLRTQKRWSDAAHKLTWDAALDFSGNIDNSRTDPDNGVARIDKYTSNNNNYGVSSRLRNEIHRAGSLVKSWEISGRMGYQQDKADITKWLQVKSASVLTNSLLEGEHDVNYMTPSYASHLTVDGRPLTAFFKAMTTLGFNTSDINHHLKLGIETNYSKNFGKGQVYDLDFPPSEGVPVRPRAFDTIPGMLNQSFYVEDMMTWRIGKHKLAATAGVRGMMLPGMDSRYAIANKIYLDPRVNVRWELPGAPVGDYQLKTTLGGGFGIHTKMPTMDHLNPKWLYEDIVQLNFYHNNPAYRIANAVTYIFNPTNYELRAAVNRKFELNADFELNGHRLSLTWFNENLTSGFRDVSRYHILAYKRYDNASVDAGNLTERPQTSDFTYTDKSRFFSYKMTANGSRLVKKGIEFQYVSKRFEGINSRITANGAWFDTDYSNSLPFYEQIKSDVLVNGEQAQYIALYDYSNGYNQQRFNTNLTMDTYLPKLGLIVSASFQNIWFTSRQDDYNSGVPVSYMGVDGVEHPYTKESLNDAALVWFKEKYDYTDFVKTTVPIDLQANIKVTKEFKKKAMISMFVNRLFTYAPDYTNVNNVRVRRGGYVTPYFGMELNFNF